MDVRLFGSKTLVLSILYLGEIGLDVNGLVIIV